ncbi:hypothetical protein AAFN85_25950 [Mucilaginibacter sp. CAU 1740]|uniref:hypothetical protein n=1 Tax=Mucilaginibacter sp. CAU 1740 TaxID=3140365 RepID=UPI00325B5332
MFKDYRTWAHNHYKQKSINEPLFSPNLKRSSPGRIRKECEFVYKERYDKKDEQTLRNFFGALKEGESYGEVIRKFDVDKFRPLDNFLKGAIEETEDKNIELLAWLLNLQPRPYQENYVYPTISVDTKKTPVDTGGKIEGEKECGETGHKSKRPVVTGVVLTILAVMITFGAYILRPQKKADRAFSGPIPPPTKGACMIWINDHYEPQRCEDVAGRDGVLGLDSVRLRNFKRITDTLKINESSVGHVWYFKNKKKIEYYTAAGYHPIDTNRWLKPLTIFIVRKYLQHPIHP